MLSVSGLYSVDDKMAHECGAVGGMKSGRGNRSTRSKLAPVPQINVRIQGISFFSANNAIILTDI
jgi:hypothetical protein